MSARRGHRAAVSELSLFHFLSILTSLMGCLIVIALAVVYLAVGPDAPENWLIEGVGPKPVLIEWDGQNMVIHPGEKSCTWGAASRNEGENNSPFGLLLRELQASQGRQFVFVAVRPSGFGNLGELLDLLCKKKVRVGYQPIEQERKLRVEE